MSFQPVVPMGGYAGWMFLKRTLPSQQAAHAQARSSVRDEAYFRERIGGIGSAQDLVADPRLLRVALTAFGLEEDLRNKAFLRKVLESSTFEPTSFVNRLADRRYRQLAEAFAFDDRIVPRNKLSGFADRILGQARERAFEAAVGQSNPDMRLALALQRDLPALARQSSSDAARWFTVLGTPSIRAVFERAFGLPASFGALDIDRQVATLKERVRTLTGDDSIAQFEQPAALEALTRRFLVVGAAGGPSSVTTANAALLLLQQSTPSRGVFR